jgi:hypothetical protein
LTQKHSVAGATFFMQSDALFEWKLNWTIVHLGVIFIYFLNIFTFAVYTFLQYVH